MYNHPEDAAAFLDHYRQRHIPLVRKMPGLSGFSVTVCEPGPDGAMPPFFLIATITADSKDAALSSFGSPEGQVAVDDTANFAGAGMQMSFGEVQSEL
jgi:uncharacterized protein (TIGR02118 family)